jgi:ribosomal protein S14
MAEPTEKSPEIDHYISNQFGIDRKAVIRANQCAICGRDADDFRDDESRREYRISGMCQHCQDLTFGTDDD